MTIQIGDRIPNASFARATAEGPKPVNTADIFAGKTVALFAVPGAFTPTCSARHLPGFKDNLEAIKGKGVDVVACISVNDAFVMKAWAESQGIDDESIVMLGGCMHRFHKKCLRHLVAANPEANEEMMREYHLRVELKCPTCRKEFVVGDIKDDIAMTQLCLYESE